MPKSEKPGELPSMPKDLWKTIQDWSGSDKSAVAEVMVMRLLQANTISLEDSGALREAIEQTLKTKNDLKMPKEAHAKVGTGATLIELLRPMVSEFDAVKSKVDAEFAQKNEFFSTLQKALAKIRLDIRQRMDETENAIKTFLSKTPPGSLPLAKDGLFSGLTVDINRLTQEQSDNLNALDKLIHRSSGKKIDADFLRQLAQFDARKRAGVSGQWLKEQRKKKIPLLKKSEITEQEDAKINFTYLMSLDNKSFRAELESMNEDAFDSMLAEFTDEQKETFFDRVDTL